MKWNSGWFGGQIGGAAWLFLGGALMVPRHPIIGLGWIIGGMMIQGIGLWLWSRRKALSYPMAVHTLLFTCGAVALAMWTWLVMVAPEQCRVWNTTPQAGYAAMLVIPALHLWLFLQSYWMDTDGNGTVKDTPDLSADFKVRH